MKPLERMLRREDAEKLLSRCVQCGFCNATCPTYLATGLELEGPRGRIGLIKSMVEGHEVSAKTQLHLDQCLTCLNCESSCPSGVEYRRIIDIGRAWMKDLIPRGIASLLPRVIVSKMM
ncbi:MAG: 4Fe-4S dicluster domain-containing protein, partial [Gammaproteobacteria bacterium]|nr:4Fe-4S dicluster domain-containing protein [Gammaproteobacteria bacterium]